MFEKVNPCHPDKVADRIAGALVDLAYRKAENPRIAIEVLIGHGVCHIIVETSVMLDKADVTAAVHRIAGNLAVDYVEVPQDGHLADNQADGVRCGDNGIFKGMPVTVEQKKLSHIARDIFSVYDIDTVTMTIYQPRRSNVSTYTVSTAELLEWAETVLKPTAELAFKGEGEFHCGEWCRFCKAKADCRERARANLALAAYDFAEPPLLTDEEVEEVLSKVDDLVSWANDIKEYALQAAILQTAEGKTDALHRYPHFD